MHRFDGTILQTPGGEAQQQQQNGGEKGEKRVKTKNSGFGIRFQELTTTPPQNSPAVAKTHYSSVQFYRSFGCVSFQNF